MYRGLGEWEKVNFCGVFYYRVLNGVLKCWIEIGIVKNKFILKYMYNNWFWCICMYIIYFFVSLIWKYIDLNGILYILNYLEK